MERFKGTPGPWFVVNSTDIYTGLGGISASGIKVDDNDGWHISDCDMGGSFVDGDLIEMDYEERQANANLIAAAPDMLEALLAAIECGMVPTSSVKDGGASRHVRQVQVADMVRAAVDKALGEV